MGRLERLRKKRHRTRKPRKDLGQRPTAASSDPEPSGTPLVRGEDQESSCTNSCDETLGLCASSLASSSCTTVRSPEQEQEPSKGELEHSTNCQAADEMEVTRKLSCLNFSMLPRPHTSHTPSSTYAQDPIAGLSSMASALHMCTATGTYAQPNILIIAHPLIAGQDNITS